MYVVHAGTESFLCMSSHSPLSNRVGALAGNSVVSDERCRTWLVHTLPNEAESHLELLHPESDELHLATVYYFVLK